MKITKKMLPKGIRIFVKDIEEDGGCFCVSFDKLKSATIKKGKIIEGVIKDDSIKLEWFKVQGLTTIMLDDVAFAEYTKEDGLVYI